MVRRWQRDLTAEERASLAPEVTAVTGWSDLFGQLLCFTILIPMAVSMVVAWLMVGLGISGGIAMACGVVVGCACGVSMLLSSQRNANQAHARDAEKRAAAVERGVVDVWQLAVERAWAIRYEDSTDGGFVLRTVGDGRLFVLDERLDLRSAPVSAPPTATMTVHVLPVLGRVLEVQREGAPIEMPVLSLDTVELDENFAGFLELLPGNPAMADLGTDVVPAFEPTATPDTWRALGLELLCIGRVRRAEPLLSVLRLRDRLIHAAWRYSPFFAILACGAYVLAAEEHHRDFREHPIATILVTLVVVLIATAIGFGRASTFLARALDRRLATLAAGPCTAGEPYACAGKVRAVRTLPATLRVGEVVMSTITAPGSPSSVRLGRDFELVDNRGNALVVHVERAYFDVESERCYHRAVPENWLATILPGVKRPPVEHPQLRALAMETTLGDGDEVEVFGVLGEAVSPTPRDRVPRETPLGPALCAGPGGWLVVRRRAAGAPASSKP